MRFEDHSVAVTGASGGIGLGICRMLAQEGATVFALDRIPPAEDTGGARYINVEMTEEESVIAATERVYSLADGPVDLVNCAGVAQEDLPGEETSAEVFDHVMSVNLRGLFLASREFGRRLLEHGHGRIVNIASMSGNWVVNVPQRQAVYNTSKAAVVGLTRSLAAEWGPRGVTVNAVSPGYTQTPMLTRVGEQKEGWLEEWQRMNVVNRFGRVDEIAAAVLYLLGPESAYCCGTELLIDGGYSLR
ncbi:SDR family oxidoreductase [Streptomyces boncukensis]|uniref:SDR family oxidoreductase n=1 Tax=Streptomyces boncukensis TaxID=2711219 RepID=A0A6G4X272_9ACTN|nr:SDR family oxidoreductase [Streptomyces boncukensis]